MRKRIGISFFYHESNTFSPVKTDLQSFYNEGFFIGDEIIAAYRGTKTEVGGFIDVLEEHNAIIVPLICAAAIPSGTVTADAYEHIKSEMLRSIREAGVLDGLLLALHGAMVVETESDPESVMLAEIRNLVGDALPIATTLDMHANLSEKMIEYTPLHFGFKTYPHIDMYEQGVQATRAMYRTLDNNQTFYASFVKLPMMPPSINMRTEEGPMLDLVESAKEMERRPGVVNASVFGGFTYSDIPEAGASIIVVSTNKREGEQAANELADQFWNLRELFILDLPGVEEGVELAIQSQSQSYAKKPIVLADTSDNPLSGGTGDTTELLREMLKRNVKNALFGALFDTESLKECMEAGAGAELTLLLGGKCSPEFGMPLEVLAKVIKVSEGKYINKGPMNTGMHVDTLGAAHIQVNDIEILLTGRALTANDPEIFRHIGIEPTKKRILGLKVKNHFRAAFDPLISRIIYIDAPGMASNSLNNFTFSRIPRPMWPLDDVKDI